MLPLVVATFAATPIAPHSDKKRPRQYKAHHTVARSYCWGVGLQPPFQQRQLFVQHCNRAQPCKLHSPTYVNLTPEMQSETCLVPAWPCDWVFLGLLRLAYALGAVRDHRPTRKEAKVIAMPTDRHRQTRSGKEQARDKDIDKLKRTAATTHHNRTAKAQLAVRNLLG